MIKVILPTHLNNLARTSGTVALDLEGPATQRSIIDAIEGKYPMLRGTLRDPTTRKRRAYVRFFACGQDVSLDPDDSPLPEDVVKGKEPFLIVGAIAGG